MSKFFATSRTAWNVMTFHPIVTAPINGSGSSGATGLSASRQRALGGCDETILPLGLSGEYRYFTRLIG